jgi:hypothetical protein
MKNDGFKIEADLEEYEDWNDDVTVVMGVVNKLKKWCPPSSYASHFINSSAAIVILSANTTVSSSNTQ